MYERFKKYSGNSNLQVAASVVKASKLFEMRSFAAPVIKTANFLAIRSITIGIVIAAIFLCIQPIHAASPDILVPLKLGQITVGGEIGRRIDVTVNNNLLVLDADGDFLLPFEKRSAKSGYIGLGKLIDAAVRFAVYTRDKRVIALKNHLVTRTIALQEPDGYVGMLAAKYRIRGMWDIHEMGYIIFGLLSDYEFFKNKKSLEAARKAADYIIRRWHELPSDWEKRTRIATHVAVTGLERTLIRLSRLTGDNSYLKFCCKERALPSWNLGIVIGRRDLIEGHIYAYMCRCLAQLELYRMDTNHRTNALDNSHPNHRTNALDNSHPNHRTKAGHGTNANNSPTVNFYHDKRLLRQTKRAIDFLLKRDGLAITGGAGQWEIWTDDQDGRGQLGETCATAYQMRIYDSLLRLEGDPKFGDLMERTMYNALFGAQSPGGRHIRYYTPFEGKRVYFMGDTYCCPCNYRRIIAELPTMVVYHSGSGIAFNFYVQSEARLGLGNGVKLSVRQETDYPDSGHVVIQIETSKPAKFPVQLRIPAWCKNGRVSVNGQPVTRSIHAGTFFKIDQKWNQKNRIILDMPMPWRLVKGRKRQSGRAALMRGPLIFCLNPSKSRNLKSKNLSTWDGADLGRITLDPQSFKKPVPDQSVRPGGIACPLKAWSPGYRVSRPGDLDLLLTEFADPGGKAIYFHLQDMSKAVDDQLFK